MVLKSVSMDVAVQYAVIVTNQSFAGHLGANELAAAAIAVTVYYSAMASLVD